MVNREQFLNQLTLVKGGLSNREFLEQSSCIVFKDGEMMTFNDEVACRLKTSVLITGAVQASLLLDVLGRLDDEELEIRENKEQELEFKGKRKLFGLTKEAEIFLPIDRVEMPKKWLPLSPAFVESVAMVQHCVSKDHSRFLLTCIHVAPEFIEACDNHQAIRCRLKSGLAESLLVRGTSLEPLVNLGVDQIAVTKSWLHFKNQQGLVYSCRRYVEDYPQLGRLFEGNGNRVVLPKSLVQAAERAKLFAVDKVADASVGVALFEDTIQISGRGASGWYKERKRIRYDGERLEFLIAPDLLAQVSAKYEEAILLDNKLKVKGDGWDYVTVLTVKGEEEAVKEETSKDDEE